MNTSEGHVEGLAKEKAFLVLSFQEQQAGPVEQEHVGTIITLTVLYWS